MSRPLTDVGPDPMKWVERLMDVNEGSTFTYPQKIVIWEALQKLHKDLRILISDPSQVG